MKIVILIILIAGVLGGSANYFRFDSIQTRKIFYMLRSLLTGVVASAVVPLFLKMTDSALLKNAISSEDGLEYLIFGGFCLIASYSSNRFMGSVSDKLIQDIKANTEEIREKAEASEKIVDLIIEKGTEEDVIDEPVFEQNIEFIKENFKGDLTDIKNTFDDRFQFRTTSGISSELGLDENLTVKLLSKLEQKDILRSVKNKKGRPIYTASQLGRQIFKKIE